MSYCIIILELFLVDAIEVLSWNYYGERLLRNANYYVWLCCWLMSLDCVTNVWDAK